MITKVPHWATAVIANYRSLFLKLHGHEWRGTDGQLWLLVKNAGTASTSEEQDAWIVQDMCDTEPRE